MSSTNTTTIELVPLPPIKDNFVQRHDDTDTAALESTGSMAPTTTVQKKATAAIIITVIAGVTTISSLLSGVVVIALPVMGKDLDFSKSLLLWPASVYSLTCGCTLILSGAVADLIGPRNMYLIGTFLQSIFTLACGLARTSIQMIIFRALAGIAIAFCLPSAVSLVTSYFPAGQRRNLAFAVMGGGYPLGFLVGLVAGGGLTDSVGWPAGFYVAAALNTFLFVFALYGLPKIARQAPLTLSRFRDEIDWIGAFILTTSLALLLYVLSTWTGNIANIKSSESISTLTIGLVLLPSFFLWEHRQQSLGKPILIRNSLWRNKNFSAICLNVFLTWGSFNATETFFTFLFQDVQKLSATAASIRFLPEVMSGTITNVLVGLYIHKLRANWALNVSFVLSAISPLLLAVMKQGSTYWEFEFPAVTLVPLSTDVLFTISQLVITAEFPDNTQALAGGVFNTVAQIGKSVGIALSAVVASSVTASIKEGDREEELLQGYQAAWWFTFAMMLTCVAVTSVGLRNIGKVGVKRE